MIGVFLVWIFVKRGRERRQLENEYVTFSQTTAGSQPTATESRKADIPPAEAAESWADRLRSGLHRTRVFFADQAKALFPGRVAIDDALLERLHEVLYRSDVGVQTADRLVRGVKVKFGSSDADWTLVRSKLVEDTQAIFSEAKQPMNKPSSGVWVVLVIGVNGVGKTTTIGKLAARFKAEGKKVMLCAADTFRAAAIEQLEAWAQRVDVPIIKQKAGADPAAVAFDGVQAAVARGMDVLIVDTAGRLHSKTELMAELGKINKSVSKGLPGAPHETWIVLDATTGQNAVQQCRAFGEVTNLSGIIMTKLDGTAKGGVVIGISDQFKIPIRFIGIGEKTDDLREFDGHAFADQLF
jgi:fused signal recognition particle receptor